MSDEGGEKRYKELNDHDLCYFVEKSMVGVTGFVTWDDDLSLDCPIDFVNNLRDLGCIIVKEIEA